MVMELNGINVIGEYVRGINLIYSDKGGVIKYNLYNGHGDVVQLTDTIGNVVKSYEYDAFGNEKNIDNNDTNAFRYAGEYFDKETGTIYLRARYYDPEIGRFITEDSVWGKDSDPLSLNLYTYCHNNPIIYIDPSGHVKFALFSNDDRDETGELIISLMSQDQWESLPYAIPEIGPIAVGAAKFGPKAPGLISKGWGLLKGLFKGGSKEITTVSREGVVLWSGGKKVMDIAAKYSKENALKTLEQTYKGKILDSLQSIGNKMLGKDKAYKLLSPLWDKASASFAQSASGQVHVFLNATGISETSVFMRIEYQILKEKGIDMIFHLVGKE